MIKLTEVLVENLTIFFLQFYNKILMHYFYFDIISIDADILRIN